MSDSLQDQVQGVKVSRARRNAGELPNDGAFSSVIRDNMRFTVGRAPPDLQVRSSMSLIMEGECVRCAGVFDSLDCHAALAITSRADEILQQPHKATACR